MHTGKGNCSAGEPTWVPTKSMHSSKGKKDLSKKLPIRGRKAQKQKSPLARRREQMLADLKRSGLTKRDAKRLGYKLVSGNRAKEMLGLSKINLPPGYIIPYPDAGGKRIPDTFRWRALDDYTQRDRKTGKHEPGPKYRQPKGSNAWLYFSKFLNWLDDDGGLIVITEGEKKADCACKAGIPTVGLGGVWNWRVPKSDDELLPDFDEVLGEDTEVEICFDSDLDTNPNVRLALARLAAALEERGHTVRVVYLSSGPNDEKVGLDDFLVEAGSKPNGKFSCKRARRAFEKLPRHDPPSGEPEAVVRRVHDVKAQPLRPLWPGVLWLGKPTLFVGDPGLGKSFVSVDIAARVTTGNGWPCGTRAVADPANVLLLSAEDAVADTIRPRLEAAGADLKRVFTLDGIRDGKSADPKHIDWISLSKHLPIIANAVRQHKARLLVIDPISAYLGTIDSHRNSEVRAVLGELGQLASDIGCAVLCISHLNKGGGGSNALYRVSGSLAFVAAPRSTYAIAEDPDDAEHRLMLPLKVNIAGPSATQSLGYRIDDDDENRPYVAWDAEPVEDKRIDEILSPPRDLARKKKEAEIEEWLRGLLKKRAVPSEEIFEQAKKRDYATRTVRKVLTQIRALCEQQGFHGGWDYRLGQQS